MARKPNERIDWFLSNKPVKEGRCLEHTWNATAIPSVGCDDANAGVAVVKNAGEMRSGPPPRGAWCWWTSVDHGHAALSMGDGNIASVDVAGPATTGVVPLSYPVEKWGHTYQGWSSFYGVEFDVGDEDDDVPLTDAEIEKIAKAVWQFQLENTSSDQPGDKERPAKWFLNRLLENVKPGGSRPDHDSGPAGDHK